jgi:flagellar export protein FliJ
MKDLKASLKRLERLFQIRETYVSVAELGVKQAEVEVRKFEAADAEVAGQIQDTKADFAYLQSATAHDLQTGEKYVNGLEKQREVIQQSLEKAGQKLDDRRREWTEAMREQKIIEKMQERRLHQCQREDDVANQKTQDDASIGRYIRARTLYDRSKQSSTDRS